MHPNGSFKHSVYNNVASSLAGVSLRSTEGYEWLTWMSTWSPRNQYLPNGDSNNFWHLWRATHENLARTWTLDHGFRVICIKNASKSVRYWHQIKMQNKQNQEKNLHHQWHSHPCVVSAPILYRVSIFATSYLIAWRPSGYTGLDILLLPCYSLDLAKILICLNLQEEEEEEDVTNHKSKQGLKQEVTSHTVTRPPMLFVAHWEKENCTIM